MARVVQQRTSPPYLLIVMVLLFLVASVMAVLWYIKADKLQKDMASTSELVNQLASAQELGNPATRQLIEASKGPEGRSVVGQMDAQIKELALKITGSPTGFQDALKQAQAALETTGKTGLVNELKLANQQVAAERQNVTELKARIQQTQQELKDAQATARQAGESLQAQLDAANARLAALDKQSGDQHGQYTTDLQEAQKDYESKAAELNKNIAEKTAQLQTAQMEMQRLNNKVADLETKLKELRGGENTEAINVVRVADGRVEAVPGGTALCYINLGSRDRMAPGLTFAVYPATGVTAGDGKGTLTVMNVGDNVSECSITSQRRDNPIVPGDLVLNVAFDRRRTNKFVVEGEFDLYGSGQATEQGAREVAMLIEKSGGQVVQEVTTDTDFVVVGSEPSRPSRPGDGAPPQEWAVFQTKIKTFDRYHAVKGQAQSLNIPVLNTNRFIALTGYTAAARVSAK